MKCLVNYQVYKPKIILKITKNNYSLINHLCQIIQFFVVITNGLIIKFSSVQKKRIIVLSKPN